MTRPQALRAGLIVGVDAGATKVRVIAADPRTGRFSHASGPGASAVVHGVSGAAGRIAWIVRRLIGTRPVESIAVGLAGAWPREVSHRVRTALRGAFKPRRIVVLNDAAAVLEALSPSSPAMLLSVGTGSFLVARANGKLGRVDGWGPLAGDAGSGAWIGRRALAAALESRDGRKKTSSPAFFRAVLRAAGLKSPEADIHRLYEAGRPPNFTASLAPIVIRFSRQHDYDARRIMASAAAELARIVEAGRRSVRGKVTLFVSGGLVSAAPELLSAVRRYARRPALRLVISREPVCPEAAVFRLAARAAGLEESVRPILAAVKRSIPRRLGTNAGLPATERVNPSTTLFSNIPLKDQLELLNAEDATIAPGVRRVIPAIARAVSAAARRIRRGGRLIYVGAGTSGRLGIMDASEIHPTFGVPDGIVIGVIAGGRPAVTRSVEGAEDSGLAGRSAIRSLRVGPRDAVAGLSASGTAPFVLSAVREARRRGAFTIGITSNPGSRLASAAKVAIAPRTGPEAIAGSTRLKAGTAQKLILNMISTCVMANLGRVSGNLMTRMVPSNRKLRDRARRIGRLLGSGAV